MDIIQSIADAIFKFESGGNPKSLAVVNNNPGNLIFIGQKGAVPVQIKGTDGKIRTYAKFPTPEAGWAALKADLQYKINRGMSLNKLIAVWAPPSDNNPTSDYAAYVAKQTGLDPTVPLISFFGQAAAAIQPAAAAVQAIPDALSDLADLARAGLTFEVPTWMKWAGTVGAASLLVYLFVE